MTLASPAHCHTVPFNGLFYATSATIIPLLFLAIAVQGQTYENIVKTVPAMYKDAPFIKTAGRMIRSSAVLIFVFAVLFAGVQAEIEAIIALQHQHATATTSSDVITGTIVIVIIAAARPALLFLGYFFGILPRKKREPAAVPAETGARTRTAQVAASPAEDSHAAESDGPAAT